MIYLIFGEGYSGVIASQALDTCIYLQESHKVDLRCIVFVSIKDYFEQRSKFKNHLKNTLVLPLIFGSKRWRAYFYILQVIQLFNKNKLWICRGAKSTYLALQLKGRHKVVYDARGAHGAEAEEYLRSDSVTIRQEFRIEQLAVLNSDFRIAVSHKLVDYWKERFGYNSLDHVVIPCTLNKMFLKPLPTKKEISIRKAELGYNEDDIILIYSGSQAGWQSISILDEFLLNEFANNEKLKLLLLSKVNIDELRTKRKYPERIKSAWLPINKVYSTLAICDYGLLIREPSITNQVASPVKFAEYLAAGLKLIISKRIGDYSELVKNNSLGFVLPTNHLKIDIAFSKTDYLYKERTHEFATKLFKKSEYKEKYLEIIN